MYDESCCFDSARYNKVSPVSMVFPYFSQDEEGNNAITGTPEDSNQVNYLELDSTMTKSDDVFTCFVEVTANETADFDVSLNTFSELPFVHKYQPQY